MAFCPKCNGPMEMGEVACPHCGYDFNSGPRLRREGIAYTPLANFALLVGTLAAGLGCLVAVTGSIAGLFQGEWITSLVVCPLAFFLQMAMLVVFVRVQNV